MRSLCFVLFTAVSLAFGCAGPLHRFEYNAIVMAAEARVVVYTLDEANARQAARAAIDRMRFLEGLMSDYQSDSELSRLSVAPAGTPQPVSHDLFRVLKASQELSAASGGAFDVTVGPLTHLWRSARQTGQLPDEAAIADARSRVNWRNMVLDETVRSVKFSRAGMQIDLGGIGKGFAVDEAMAVLRQHGLTRCLVGLSGDIAVGDAPPNQRGWRVTIRESADSHTRQLMLVNTAISTSGDTYQHVIVDDVRRSHIINPHVVDGFGIADQQSLTVIAASATIADGLATALSIIDPAERERLLRHYDARVIELDRRRSSGQFSMDP